jgi:hypothetical protein
MTDRDEIQRKLQKIIAQLESLKETLDGDDLQQASAPLWTLKGKYEAQLAGSGAIAGGEGAQAVGQDGVLVGRDVSGTLVKGNHNTVIVFPAPGCQGSFSA